MATTEVDLCNRALLLLGASTITSITGADISSRAVACSIIYPPLRDALLAMHPWRFATGKVQLARLSAAPVNEWKYAYQLPSDLIAGPYAVFNSDQGGAVPMTSGFEIFQDALYTNDTLIVIDYRFRPDENKFPSWFQWLLVLAMTGAIAPEVTDIAALAVEYNQRAFGSPGENFRGGYFAIAATQNAQSNPAIKIEDSTITNARFS